MARAWCVVVETLSDAAAHDLWVALEAEGADVEVEPRRARVTCFANSKSQAEALREQILRVAGALPGPVLHGTPQTRVWNYMRRLYVDPAAPYDDPDATDLWIDAEFAPGEVAWRVRLHLESEFELLRLRAQLPALRRPVIGTGTTHVDLGTRDLADAQETAARALALPGVAAAESRKIRSRFARWRVRQRLAGNHADEPAGSRYGYWDLGGSGIGSGDGGDGDGGNGGGD